MKQLKTFTFLLAFLTLGNGEMMAQGMEFFHGTFEEALEKAKTEDKAIFVDAYTTWCGPCKRMAKLVFTLPEVGEFYNSNFINLKLDMEKPEGREFSLNYPVSAYPTFYYIRYDGETLYSTKGGRNPEQFIELGEKALSRYDNIQALTEKYDEGERDPKFMLRYIKALNRSGEGGLKVANDYLNSQSDLTTLENLAIISAATVEADSRIFYLYMQHGDKIKDIVGEESFVETAEKACMATVDKAIEYQYEDLLGEAQSKYAKINSDEAEQFELTTNMKYFAATRDAKSYMKNAKKYLKKYVGNDAMQLNASVASMIEDFQDNAEVMDFAEDYAEKAAEYGGLAEYYLMFAYTQYYQKEYDDARKSAEKALELAESQKFNTSPIKSLLNSLDQM